MLTSDDQRESKKKIVEFALREEKFLSQIESIKMALSMKQQKIDELESRNKKSSGKGKSFCFDTAPKIARILFQYKIL